jgi:hypothetical protein
VSDAELASNYSGIGACGANTFASTLNDNAAPTCTQPNFTDLAGTATAAQTPLATLLAGRTGTGNDTKLSTDSDGTLYGSSTTAKSLILRANSADTTTSEIFLNAPSVRTPNNLTFDPDATAAQNFIKFTDGTETVSGFFTAAQFTPGTYTVTNNTSGLSGFAVTSSVIEDYTAVTNPVFGLLTLFNAAAEIRPTGGAAVSSGWAAPYVAAVTFNPTNAGTTMTMTDAPDYDSTPIFKVTSTGAFGATAARSGFHAKSTVSSGTVSSFRGFIYDDKTGAGTLSLQVGVDIAALGNATSNIGIRNADTTVFTSGATQSIASGGATQINCTATFIEIDYPTGGAVTDSNAPTVGDGSDGQVCIIVNVDSADTITLKDEAITAGTNLRLPGKVSYAMAPRDTLTLLYSSTLADWITVASSHN